MLLLFCVASGYVENPIRSPASGNRPIQEVVTEDEKDMFYSCVPDNTENTVAFFQQVGKVLCLLKFHAIVDNR